MLGLLLPAIGFVVLYLLLRLVMRSWPSASGHGGYANWRPDDADRGRALSEERGRAIREDDDVRWHWTEDGARSRG